MKILCIGPLWRGSNAGGLFKAFGRQGCLIEVVDEFYYLSLQQEQSLPLKICTKILRPWQIQSFNLAILSKFSLVKPDILLVYKGAFIKSTTLIRIKQRGAKLVNFYPDVSMFSHGKLLPQTMPLFDLVFTTKTFGKEDLRNAFGVENSVFIPHGFDPEIHRLIPGFNDLKQKYVCDVSFIGTWSPKKEALLAKLKTSLPGIELKIWGNQWHKSKEENLKKSIQHNEVLGDLYALAIQSSTINLGILSERVRGASSGDRITSRTFHIPGSGGFLLHERNAESVQYYQENKEAAFFETPEELADKVQYYLNNPEKREAIRLAGYKRALADHSLDSRAKTVLAHLHNLLKV
ncbi:MAG: glycosyltransferase [Lewinellaceae bacterium]|nr:glycosyltransferase [Lewinellaceae bacterium]